MACGPFFFRPRSIGVYLDDRAVESERFDLDADDLFFLQSGEDPVQHTGSRPPIHPRVDCVPPPKSPWQTAPLAAVLSYEQDGVQHVPVGDSDVSPLFRETSLDPLKLLLGDMHAATYTSSVSVNRP